MKMCGRCFDEVQETFTTNCNEWPEARLNQSFGMYHCPDCGAMILAGLTHPKLCRLCLERKHPMIDIPVILDEDML